MSLIQILTVHYLSSLNLKLYIVQSLNSIVKHYNNQSKQYKGVNGRGESPSSLMEVVLLIQVWPVYPVDREYGTLVPTGQMYESEVMS